MKFKHACLTCANSGKYGIFLNLEYTKDMIYTSTPCNNGHQMYGILNIPEFELFLACAAEALLNSYFIEACFNLSVAREKFFIFAINIMLHNDYNNDDLKEFKKGIFKSSERALGAFSALYSLYFKKSFNFEKKLNEMNIIEFRNKIIHKGYLPSKDEAYKYGEVIFDEIVDILKLIYTSFGKLFMKYSHQIVNSNKAAENAAKEPSYKSFHRVDTAITASLLSTSLLCATEFNNTLYQYTFTERLNEYEEYLKKLESYANA